MRTVEKKNVAVDYSRFERRQKAVEPEVPLELVEQPRRRVVHVRTKLPYKALLTLALAAVSMIAVIISYNSVWTANAVNAQLDRDYQQLKAEEQQLMQQEVGNLSLREIEQQARTEYNMNTPTQDQIVYISMNGTDSAEVYHQEGFLERVGNWIADLF